MRITNILSNSASEFARVTRSTISTPGAAAAIARPSSSLTGHFEVLRGNCNGSDALKKLAVIAEMSAAAAERDLEELAERQRQEVQNKQSERSQETTIDRIRDGFDAASKDLESQDKLGNFRIQDLMSEYNQGESLASNVLQKLNQGTNSAIANIG